MGHCIYCHAENVPLGAEHIVPEGLGGAIVLPAASCRKCERVTSGFETSCIQNMFNVIRYHAGIPSRSRHIRNPSAPLYLEIGESTSISRKPLSDHPVHFAMFTFPPPDLLLGLPPRTGGKIQGGYWYHSDENRSRILKKFGAKAGITNIKMDPPAFLRMLAKIAFSYAHAEIGGRNLSKDTLALIFRNKYHRKFQRHIGGSYIIEPATDNLHELDLYQEEVSGGSRLIRSKRYLWVVRVRLFAKYGAPTYHVVVSDA